ncbi:glycoside hydrolase family 3 N-terminal domain-containing protein [Microbacterium sp. YY-01]|uniref:glycoside hydrolase family 3 N-terminal domain-containing protein n=1 Tax=Microbacterium sp. YY-01 TaxID=3421634 RepID=UPI003D1855AF
MTTDSTLRRLASGVLWPGFIGTRVPPWLAAALKEGLAGVVYFGHNISADTTALSEQIHQLNPHALIGIDEEGGSVTRLEAASGSTLPGHAQLGMVNSLHATEKVGYELARRCATEGIDIVIAPVADVNTNAANPVIGVRSFGSDTATVAAHTAAMITGIQRGGLSACAKHFPGHGDTAVDSHHGMPTITASTDEVCSIHLPPFVAAINAHVDAIMTAHIRIPEWGDEPATLNPTILARLRDAHFTGVIVTDAIDMAAIRDTRGLGEGAVQALAAGVDLVCIGNPTNPGAAARPDQDEHDYREALDAVVDALATGRLSTERIEQAHARVAALAAQAAQRRSAASGNHPPLDTAELHRIAQASVRIHGTPWTHPDQPVPVLDIRRHSTLAVDSTSNHVARALAAGGPISRVHPDVQKNGTLRDELSELLSADTSVDPAPAAGPVVVVVDRFELGSPQRELVRAFAREHDDLTVVNVGPYCTDASGTLGSDGPNGRPATALIEVGAASALAAQVAREYFVSGRQEPA